MRQDILLKILDCASITGDTVIFEHRGRPLVIMGFDAYQASVHAQEGVARLSEQELLDKINRTIALWKQERVQEDIDIVKEYDTIQEPHDQPVSEESVYLEVMEEIDRQLSDDQDLKEDN